MLLLIIFLLSSSRGGFGLRLRHCFHLLKGHYLLSAWAFCDQNKQFVHRQPVLLTKLLNLLLILCQLLRCFGFDIRNLKRLKVFEFFVFVSLWQLVLLLFLFTEVPPLLNYTFESHSISSTFSLFCLLPLLTYEMCIGTLLFQRLDESFVVFFHLWAVTLLLARLLFVVLGILVQWYCWLGFTRHLLLERGLSYRWRASWWAGQQIPFVYFEWRTPTIPPY